MVYSYMYSYILYSILHVKKPMVFTVTFSALKGSSSVYSSYSSLFVLNISHLCTALQGDLLKDVFCKEEGLQYCILQRL